MVTVREIALVLAVVVVVVPVKPWNWFPAFGVAVIVTGVPGAYQPPVDGGDTVTVPAPTAAVVSWKYCVT
jgi:hypothetical protein